MVRHFLPLDVVGDAGSQLLDVFRREMEDLAGRIQDGDGDHDAPAFTPRTNVAETETAYEFTLDVPGMKSEDFQIELHEGRLSITGERVAEESVEGRKLHRAERHFGKFVRTFKLGHEVNAEKVTAEYNAGVLNVVVEKSARAQPTKIQVK